MSIFLFYVLGLKGSDLKSEDRLSPVMDLLLQLREEARNNKDWATSDKIRDGLASIGITIKDSKNGSTWD